MEIIVILLSLIALFYFLAKAADIIVLHIRNIGEELKIRVFFLGLLLGFFTSLPEMTIGVNAYIKNLGEISVGNLLGGIIVLFGLILGLSLIIHRGVKTDGKILSFLPILIYIMIPFVLAADGKLMPFDGLILISAYIFLLFHLYNQNKTETKRQKMKFPKEAFLKNLSVSLVGVFLLVIVGNIIIRLTLLLAENLNISTFTLGAVIFAIGTNLPEIVVSFEAWRKKIRGLSISNLIGSAMANPAIIGVFALLSPITFQINFSYYLLMGFTIFLLVMVMIFYETKKSFSRKEGVMLVLIYIAFLGSQMFFLGTR